MHCSCNWRFRNRIKQMKRRRAHAPWAVWSVSELLMTRLRENRAALKWVASRYSWTSQWTNHSVLVTRHNTNAAPAQRNHSLYKFKASNFLANSLNVNAVVRCYCYNLVSEDRKRIFEFLRDLVLSCRDCYGRDGKCILSRDEMCDIIHYLSVE